MKASKLDHSDKQNLKLHNAVLSSNVAKVSEYCNKADTINTIDELDPSGLAAIHIAIKNKNAELVDLLLEGGASPNKTTAHGESPVILAIIEQAPELLSRLIEGHADINLPDPQGRSPLKIATDLKNTKCAEILRDHGALFGTSKFTGLNKTTETSTYVESIISAVKNCVNDKVKFVSFKQFQDTVLHRTTEYIPLSPSLFATLSTELEAPLNHIFDALIKLANSPGENLQRECINMTRKVIVAVNSHTKPYLLKQGDHSSLCLMSKAESSIEDRLVKERATFAERLSSKMQGGRCLM